MFVLVGPSASGKSTVAQVLVEQLGMKRAVTTTTRKRRRWEPVDAYHFVSKESFRVDDMVESQEYAGNYYGLSKAEADGSNLVILEPKGYVTLVKDFQSPPYHKGRASFPTLQKIFGCDRPNTC